jgi:hypothetical protein
MALEPGLIFVLILLISAANLGALYAIIRLAVLSALTTDGRRQMRRAEALRLSDAPSVKRAPSQQNRSE